MGYQGLIVELPLGGEGLTGSRSAGSVRPAQLLEADSLTYEDRTLRKEGGASKYNSTAITGTPQVIAGHDWWPTDGAQRMVVVTSDGKILKDSGGGTFGTTLASGLTVAGTIPVFVEGGKEAAAGNRKLFCFTGKNAVQVLSADGATTAALATPPADWSGANQPLGGAVHEGRLWGFGNLNDPHRTYYSTPTDHEDFTGANSGSLSIFPGEGERILAGVSFKGYLVLFKFPVGIYLADTSSATLANWRVVRLTGAVGIASPLAWCVVDDDILFLDATANLQLLSAVTEFGDIASRNLSEVAEMGPFIRNTFNLAQLGETRAVYYNAKREAHFAIARTGATKNTGRLVVDFSRLDLPRFRWSSRDTCQSLWLKKDSDKVPRMVSGDDAGFVWNMDQAGRSKDGSGYNGQFQTPHHDLSFLEPALAAKRKNFDFLEIIVDPKGNWNLGVDVYIDGALKQTLAFNMGTTGSTLGSFVLGTDKLAGDQVLNRKKRLGLSGRRISLVGRNSGAGQDFSVARMILHFRPSDERMN
ncbi:MAG: hypothetical protein ACE5JS_21340 [Nitrospinota bacterium]